MPTSLPPPVWPQQLARAGFAFVPAPDMLQNLHVHPKAGAAPTPADWPAFAASWNDLAPDTYLAVARGRYRRRRHATFRADADGIHRLAHQPHYQSREYNALQGGIERWFEPLREDIGAGASLTAILALCRRTFDALAPATPAWHIEVHQFRIEARAGEAGEPTPEGVHRDGVDYVLVLMIERLNIERGATSIRRDDGTELGHFTLARPFDAAWLDDRSVFHGVTPVVPKDPAAPAHRDVLVVTFRAV